MLFDTSNADASAAKEFRVYCCIRSYTSAAPLSPALVRNPLRCRYLVEAFCKYLLLAKSFNQSKMIHFFICCGAVWSCLCQQIETKRSKRANERVNMTSSKKLSHSLVGISEKIINHFFPFIIQCCCCFHLLRGKKNGLKTRHDASAYLASAKKETRWIFFLVQFSAQIPSRKCKVNQQKSK